MRASRTHQFRLATGLCAGLVLAGCGDNLREQAVFGAGAGAATAVALDRNLLTGAAAGAATNIAYCSRYPSRC